MAAEQIDFFSSLDFPGRTTVMLWEIGERLGLSVRHLLNEVDSGAIVGLDMKARGASRRCIRVPLECYHAYVWHRLTGAPDVRAAFIQSIPAATRLALIAELRASLKAS